MIERILSSKFLQNIGIYTASNILNAAIPFLLLPVLTRYLSAEDYGITATFQTLIGFFMPFIGLNTQGSITRKYFNNDKINFASHLTTCLLILFASAICFSIILLPAAPFFSMLTEFPLQWFWSVLAVAFFQYVCTVVLGIWQVKGNVYKYSIFQNTQTVLNITCSLFFIISLNMNWQGRISGQLVAAIVFGLMGGFFLSNMKLLTTKVSFQNALDALKFGLPLIPYSFSGWVLLSMDRIFINKMVGLEQTGLYSAAFQICMVITLVQTSFNNAWVPWIYQKINDNNKTMNIQIVRFSYLFILCNFLLAFLIAFLGPFFIKIFLGKDFFAASDFLLWLSLAQAANAIHIIAVSYIFYYNKNVYLTYAALFTTLIHIPLTYFLIQQNGTIGAAQSLFISNIFASVCTFIFANKFHKMPWLLNLKRGKLH
jgi:O-antigen/teichoic acid export membrane protein